ncbi:MAG: V-type ATP synthase subunit E [Bacteroidota bacterium]
MPEINNLEKLTDKIYQEGVRKAEEKSEAIVKSAEEERNRILAEAEAEAKRIIAEAQQQATRAARSTENELTLKGKQLISDLKVEIHQLLSAKILENGMSDAFADVSFLQSAILEAIRSWNSVDNLELMLPSELEKKLEKAFHHSVREHAENLTITFNDKISGGFRIAKKDDFYQISFSENEFNDLFKSYLSEKTNQLLFNESL